MKPITRKQFFKQALAGIAGLTAVALGKGEGESKPKVNPPLVKWKHRTLAECQEMADKMHGDMGKYISRHTLVERGEKWRRNERLYYGIPSPHSDIYKIHLNILDGMRDITG